MRPIEWQLPDSMAWVGLALLCACTPAEEQQPASRRDRVVLAERGQYYDYAFVPAPSLSEWSSRLVGQSPQEIEARWRRELGELGATNHATGSISGVALDDAGEPMVLPERPEVPLRYTCGATLISPSHVITAAHCAADDMGPITLEMYRPTTQLAASAASAQVLSGTWPDFSHSTLGEEEGYLVDEYPCELLVRCDARWGPTVDCPYGTGPRDVAVLRCSGEPGSKYGFVPLADEQAASGTEVFMLWKHEVYDFENSTASASELDAHYLSRGQLLTNYHYQGALRNQLLPLRSISWVDGTPRTATTDGWTDLMGCHGTSGSGLLSLDQGAYRLWGVVTSGSADLTDALCQDSAERVAQGEGPGSSFIGSNWLEPDILRQQIQGALEDDCRVAFEGSLPRRALGSLLDGSEYRVATWFSGLDCQPLSASSSALGVPFPLEAQGGAGFELLEGQSLTVGDFTVMTGQAYRASVQVDNTVPCEDGCADFQLALGNELPVSFSFDSTDMLPGSAAVSFVPSASGAVALLLDNLGTPSTFTGPTLIAEGQANTFDTPFDRMEASLFSLTPEGVVGPAPMRFTGDGYHGFAALLRGGERMLLTRQALLDERSWTVRVEASDYTFLSCGFVDARGSPQVTAPCAEVFGLDARGAERPPSAFYVEADPQSGDVEVAAVALASDAADDADEDGIADVLDDCSGEFNPSQLGCLSDAGTPPGPGGTSSPDSGTDGANTFADAGTDPLPSSGGQPDAGRPDASARGVGGASAVSSAAVDAGEPGPDATAPISGGGTSGSGGHGATPDASALPSAPGASDAAGATDSGATDSGATDARASHAGVPDAGATSAPTHDAGCACRIRRRSLSGWEFVGLVLCISAFRRRIGVANRLRE